MVCPLCFLETWPDTPLIPLSDGRFVHKTCIESIERDFLSTQGRITELNISIIRAEQIIQKQKNIFRKISYLLLGKKIDPVALEKDILTGKSELDTLRIKRENLSAQLENMYDFYLEYPPDWNRRRRLVKERDFTCENCGTSGRYGNRLNVHHRKHLAAGGTNRLDNLVLLCERCHKEEHGVSRFGGERDGKPPAIQERQLRINEAISKHKEIEFLYKKYDEEHFKKRVVVPYEIVTLEHRDGEGFSLCVRGYCKLRQAERVFSLRRMKALKLRD